MATTHAREREHIPANRALAAKGGSWAMALVRAQKAPVNERPQRAAAGADRDLPAYSLFVPAGFTPRGR